MNDSARTYTPACGTCAFSVPNNEGSSLECHLMPPEVSVLLIPMRENPSILSGAPGRQGLAHQVVAAWPPVRPDQFCFQYQPKNGLPVINGG